MTQQNLFLTEKSIKNHCKRLQKEMKNYNQDLSLGEIQNLFSRTLGFNNFHELKTIIKQKKEVKPVINNLNDFYKFLTDIEKKSGIIWLFENGEVQYEVNGFPDNEAKFVSTNSYGLTNKDFQNIINMLLSQNEISVLLKADKNDYVLVHVNQKINDNLLRYMTVQVYKKNNKISSIKFLPYYRARNSEETFDGFDCCKKYPEVKDFF